MIGMILATFLLLASVSIATGHDDVLLPSRDHQRVQHDDVYLPKSNMNKQPITTKQTKTSSFLWMTHNSFGKSSRAMADNAPMSHPINLISDLFFEGQEMCMSLPSPDSTSVILAVCDGSNNQKWYNVSGTLQSFINEDMCLDAGYSASPGAILSNVQCDGSLSQTWMGVDDAISNTIVNAEHDTFIMANGCNDLSSDNTNVLIQSILTGSASSNWTQLGSDIDGEGEGDWLGYSVGLSPDGMTVVIGAPKHDGNGSNSGYVQVYSYDETASSWTKVGDDIDGEGFGDESGTSVAISNDSMTVAVGARYNDGNNGSNSGHVRIYSYDENAGNWTQLGADIDGEGEGDQLVFSRALSNDGKTVAIGAIFNDGNGSNSGHVRVYSYDEGTSAWIQVGADIDGEAANDRSGFSIALSNDGTIIAIGARFNDGNGSNSGHVRVFSYDESAINWTQLGADIDGEAVDDQSGYSVAISDDGLIVAVGAPHNDSNGSNSGHARVYSYDESVSEWSQVGGDIDGEAAHDNSGFSVALASNGRTIAVGARANDGNGLDSGHVRVYSYDESTTSKWSQVGADIDGEAADDRSGRSVGLSSDGKTIVVGAPKNSDSALNSGHVRVYSLIETASTCEDQKKWITKTTSFDFSIARTAEDARIEDGTDSPQKIIGIDYELADYRYKNDVNITIFKDDCLTTLGSDVLPFEHSSNGHIVTLDVTYKPNDVESSDIWNPTFNGAGDVTGGSFAFCARAAVVDVLSGYEMDFNETNFFIEVLKTTGTDFSLTVEVDRDDAGEEDKGDVSFSGSIRGFQCDIDSFSENVVAVSQGSSLGLCVESTVAGIFIAGWQTLTLSRDGFDFEAISDGSIPAALSNLVETDCVSVSGRCVSEVELVGRFFDSDGTLTVDGTVVLGFGFPNDNGAAGSRRRRLANVHAEINQSNDAAVLVYPRKLDEVGDDIAPRADESFGFSVSVLSAAAPNHHGPSSTATTFLAPAFLSLSLIVSSLGTMINMIGFMY